jgi:hypothetical protein
MPSQGLFAFACAFSFMQILKNSRMGPSVAQPQNIHDEACSSMIPRLSQQVGELTKKNAEAGLKNKKPPT